MMGAALLTPFAQIATEAWVKIAALRILQLAGGRNLFKSRDNN